MIQRPQPLCPMYSIRPAAWVALLIAAVAFPAPVLAQDGLGTLRVRTVSDDGPVAGATVRVRSAVAVTGVAGEAVLRVPAGPQEVEVEGLGFADARVEVRVAVGGETVVEIVLTEAAEELEGIVVSSTRMQRRIEEEPVRVEVLAQEEIEEKTMMTPGDISMMLNETSGLRVQNTSPSLGGANVRIQGLRGRYTQILSDGLPLYGGQSGSLSMLQVPPMDLGQVEVIKGAASALYGATALGGVINLISRRPEVDERELLLNQSSLGGTDGVLWLADELDEAWGYTFLGGLHRHSRADVDGDGWSDQPGYRRAIVRPRLFWGDGAGTSVFLTAGTTLEEREGGTQDGRLTPAGTEFPEALDTRRADFGLVGSFLLEGDRLVSVRASGMVQRHEHLFGDATERDLHSNAFGEATYGGSTGRHTWLFGVALQREAYEADDVSDVDFYYWIPSLLVQDEYAPVPWLTVAGSGRLDRHSEYGWFLNPRLSALLRPGDGWTVRASAGTGYFAPTPFTEETEAVGLGRLLPMEELDPERARSASLDVGRVLGDLEVNATVFGSIVEDAVQVRAVSDRLQLVSAPETTRTWGAELLGRWQSEPFLVTATYSHLRATEGHPEANGRREVPMTPRHSAGIVGMWEVEGERRVGVELYYTGRQALEDNPYRATSRPYFLTGVLVEQRWGPARVFINFENILDVRQTGYDPLVRPERAPEGRWTTDAWAPLEGRAINGGVRIAF